MEGWWAIVLVGAVIPAGIMITVGVLGQGPPDR
jgi:hypothetical protein